MNAHVSIMDTAAPATSSDRAMQEAYREWLSTEGNICGMELYPELGADGGKCVPVGTLATNFHTPSDRHWRDVPPPSTRARLVLEAVGAIPAAPSPELAALIASFEKAEAARLKLVARYVKVEKEVQKAFNGKMCPEFKIPEPNRGLAVGRIPFSSSKEANERCDEAVRRVRARHAAGFLLGRILDRDLAEIEMLRTEAVEHLRREEAIVAASGIFKLDERVSAATDVADEAWEAIFDYRCVSMADVQAKVSVILAHTDSYPVTEDDVENLLRSLIGLGSAGSSPGMRAA